MRRGTRTPACCSWRGPEGWSWSVSGAERLTTAGPTPLARDGLGGAGRRGGDRRRLGSAHHHGRARGGRRCRRRQAGRPGPGTTTPSRRPRRRSWAPSASEMVCSPTMTSSTTTVTLSLPPASVGHVAPGSRRPRCGSRVAVRTSVICSEGTSLVSPSEHSRNRSPFFGDDLPHVDVDVGLDTQSPGQDVAVGVDGRLLLRELAPCHELLGHGMVGGELDQLVAVQPVRPRVTHVGEHQPVAVVGRHQGRRDHRGPHAPQVDVGAAALPHRPVRLVDGARPDRRRTASGRTRPAGCRWRCGPRSPLPTWPPIPSATANRVRLSSARSSLTVRTRPTSEAEPDRRTVNGPSDQLVRRIGARGAPGRPLTGTPRRRCRPPGAGRPCPAWRSCRCARR